MFLTKSESQNSWGGGGGYFEVKRIAMTVGKKLP